MIEDQDDAVIVDEQAIRDLSDPRMWLNPLDLRAVPSLAPSVRGVYGWWFDEAPGAVPLDGTIVRDGYRWLYVGVAGGRANSRRTLRHRLLEHVRGPAKVSTLRRTLAALLREELSLRIDRLPNGKVQLLDDGETRLTEWMSLHMRVALVSHDDPRRLEAAVLRSGTVLPLNIQSSSHAFAMELKRRRLESFS